MSLDRKTPMKRGKGLKRGGRIAQKSAKRLTEDVFDGPRSQVRDATFARDNYRCVAHRFFPSLPCTAAVECDEFQGRGREPGSHLDPTKTQTLCVPCHRFKTDKPRAAGLLGLYGPTEQARRLSEEGPGSLTWAAEVMAKSKARHRWGDAVGGINQRAVENFADERGVDIPKEAWSE